MHRRSTPHKRRKATISRLHVKVLMSFCLFLAADLRPLAAQDGMERGTVFAHWGYNRAWYSGSDIHFNGPGYDFTLRQVHAKDRPEAFRAGLYFGPTSLWIPQYNYRVGWFFAHGWSLSLGLDHMKYVVVQDQRIQFTGHVDAIRTVDQTVMDGPQEITLDRSLLIYEHTDGLNLLSVDVDRHERLWQSRDAKFMIRAFEGLHAGPVIPRTDVRLFGKGLNNRWNLAGFGVGAQAGFQLDLFRHFYIRDTLRAGWIDLPRVLTTGEREDHAKQHFWFVQHAIMVGVQFRIDRRADDSGPPREPRE